MGIFSGRTFRHCERQRGNPVWRRLWIASSLALLAMTLLTTSPAFAACTSCGGLASERVVFVAAAGNGNKGGISGADASCQAEAASAGLSGNYKAWLADSNPFSAPYYRFPHSTVPYKLVDGTKVADDWTDLTDGTLDAPIWLTASGGDGTAGVTVVAANITIGGMQKSASTGAHCSNWTSNNCSATSDMGRASLATSGWTDYTTSYGCCSGQRNAYCFETGYTCTSPSGNEGDIMYNESQGVMQYCAGVVGGSSQWRSFPKHAAAAPATTDPCLPASSPSIGTVCADGTVYAGVSPDGNVPMYAARCDVGMAWNGSACVGTRRSLPWNDGTTSFTGANTTGESNTDGDGNTTVEETFLVSGIADRFLMAARSCGTLGQDGYTDWYLPARDELQILYTNYAAIGNFNTAFVSTNRYWSSTDEVGVTTGAWQKRFYDGASVVTGKDATDHVRCVRHGYKQPCANPTAPRASMIYNSTYNVVQWCDNNGNWQPAGPVPGAGGGGCSAPTGAKGDMVYNSTYRALTYCDGAKWIRVGAEIDPCAGVPSPGTVCKDGTVFAGFTPADSTPMYTTPADAPNHKAWSTEQVVTGATSFTDGEANVNTITSGFTLSNYPAFEYCENLVAHGHSDWYLPATSELSILCTNKTAIGGFGTPNYWGSNEVTSTNGRQIIMSNCAANNNAKTTAEAFRCVRR